MTPPPSLWLRALSLHAHMHNFYYDILSASTWLFHLRQRRLLLFTNFPSNQVLLTVSSLFGNFSRKVKFRGGRTKDGGKPKASGCSPHTSFRGQRRAHGPLLCVGSSLCFLSLCLGLMNKPLATVGLSVTAAPQQDKRHEGDKGDFIWGKGGAGREGRVFWRLEK